MRSGLVTIEIVVLSVALVGFSSDAWSQEGADSQPTPAETVEGTGLSAGDQPCGEGAECPRGHECVSGTCQLQCDDAALPHVYFEWDFADIRVDQEASLDHVIACMTALPDRRIRVEGHTDERGTSEDNFAISERRARAAKRYLERSGIDPSRIETVGFGEERPICTESNETCWRQNGRTEFHWVEPEEGGATPEAADPEAPATE
jgi:outer membrane protein OmpA-like peptidoglycan-associated protein